MRRNTFC